MLWVLGSGSSKCVFLKIIPFLWNIFFLTSMIFLHYLKFGGWGETVKAFWIGMLWNSKYRFLECHFINGSFWKYLIKNFWKWRCVKHVLFCKAFQFSPEPPRKENPRIKHKRLCSIFESTQETRHQRDEDNSRSWKSKQDISRRNFSQPMNPWRDWEG